MSWLPSWNGREKTLPTTDQLQPHPPLKTKKRYDAFGEAQRLTQMGNAEREMSKPGAVCQDILRKYERLTLNDLASMADKIHTCIKQDGTQLSNTFKDKAG